MNSRFGSRAHSLTLVALVVLLAVVLSIMAPSQFPTIINMQSMLNKIAPLGILAICIGLTFLIGGIDLSIVAVANGAAVTVALVSNALGPTLGAAAVPSSSSGHPALRPALATPCPVPRGSRS